MRPGGRVLHRRLLPFELGDLFEQLLGQGLVDRPGEIGKLLRAGHDLVAADQVHAERRTDRGLISPAFSSKAARENDSSIGPWRPILPSRPPCLPLGPAEYFFAAAAKSSLPEAISARIDSACFSRASISFGPAAGGQGEEECG